MLATPCTLSRGKVIGVSVGMFVCVFVDTKMSSLSETGQIMSSTYYVRERTSGSREKQLLKFFLLYRNYFRRSQFGLTYGSACYSYSCEMNKY